LAARLTGWKIDIMEDGDGTSGKLTNEEAEKLAEESAVLADKLAVAETEIEPVVEEVVEVAEVTNEEAKPKKEKKAKAVKAKKAKKE
jgi:hypothetical protein